MQNEIRSKGRTCGRYLHRLTSMHSKAKDGGGVCKKIDRVHEPRWCMEQYRPTILYFLYMTIYDWIKVLKQVYDVYYSHPLVYE